MMPSNYRKGDTDVYIINVGYFYLHYQIFIETNIIDRKYCIWVIQNSISSLGAIHNLDAVELNIGSTVNSREG